MLDNLEIHIEELEIGYFDSFDKVWCVDAWWHDDSNVNTSYNNGDGFNDRCAVIATISEDGETLKWNDNFEDAINDKGNFNDWVLEEIEDRMRVIKEDYLENHG